MASGTVGADGEWILQMFRDLPLMFGGEPIWLEAADGHAPDFEVVLPDGGAAGFSFSESFREQAEARDLAFSIIYQ